MLRITGHYLWVIQLFYIWPRRGSQSKTISSCVRRRLTHCWRRWTCSERIGIRSRVFWSSTANLVAVGRWLPSANKSFEKKNDFRWALSEKAFVWVATIRMKFPSNECCFVNCELQKKVIVTIAKSDFNPKTIEHLKLILWISGSLTWHACETVFSSDPNQLAFAQNRASR